MLKNMRVDPHSGVPVYKQMVGAIASAIESNDLEIGEKLPSIRQLSAQLNVNPNTTAKVYRELELKGFIESKAGSGSFVLPQDEQTSAYQKNARIQALYDKMLSEARALQINEQDLVEFLQLRTER